MLLKTLNKCDFSKIRQTIRFRRGVRVADKFVRNKFGHPQDGPKGAGQDARSNEHAVVLLKTLNNVNSVKYGRQ
ncbi:hypothetical protein GCM10011357_18870 [Lacimicrobium alkaliphilum]|uniref:Uncharacterized protein n=1 Tax=Lacimicrobium alkaliphilum TaxID=1526571 RepID=A0ABQ1RDQ4_9ALTE|nr:hypothetical protein GCM10011357_18870 [Lacimicrobium alkaliphilum]